ncbi:hypothetical protein [Azospirillum halopraeferens]|uniref:hypothetical protein n=1 Tax=Azospirillum halopraeferens TaxID=34010 RepID=UPI0012EC49B6|nr:hypothetical protein [Azospirillum halopraeferens]
MNMTNVKDLYAAQTRAAKKHLTEAAGNAKPSAGYEEEERLIARFRKRAREDFKTLRPASSSSGA